LLHHLEYAERSSRRKRFGRATAASGQFDLVCNADTFDAEQMAQLIESATRARGILEQGYLSPSAEAQLQFQFRLSLAKHGIHPTGRAAAHRKPNAFVHPSEQIFANLLDFYRIAWEYEPRSFPVQWDTDGNVLEAFTPDFYLPEFDLYVEITTMKQSLVTKKNRKVKLLKTIYPHLNIQVFYQKDFQDLVFKYGLAESREPQPVAQS
jgi:hypoxanthine phosphoribosyltransferase